MFDVDNQIDLLLSILYAFIHFPLEISHIWPSFRIKFELTLNIDNKLKRNVRQTKDDSSNNLHCSGEIKIEKIHEIIKHIDRFVYIEFHLRIITNNFIRKCLAYSISLLDKIRSLSRTSQEKCMPPQDVEGTKNKRVYRCIQ